MCNDKTNTVPFLLPLQVMPSKTAPKKRKCTAAAKRTGKDKRSCQGRALAIGADNAANAARTKKSAAKKVVVDKTPPARKAQGKENKVVALDDDDDTSVEETPPEKRTQGKAKEVVPLDDDDGSTVNTTDSTASEDDNDNRNGGAEEAASDGKDSEGEDNGAGTEDQDSQGGDRPGSDAVEEDQDEEEANIGEEEGGNEAAAVEERNVQGNGTSVVDKAASARQIAVEDQQIYNDMLEKGKQYIEVKFWRIAKSYDPFLWKKSLPSLAKACMTVLHRTDPNVVDLFHEKVVPTLHQKHLKDILRNKRRTSSGAMRTYALGECCLCCLAFFWESVVPGSYYSCFLLFL